MENQFIGQYVTDPAEVQKEVEQMKQKPDYKTVIKEVQKLVSLNEEDLKAALVYQFDMVDSEEEFIINKVVLLATEDGKIRVELFNTEKEEENFESISATFIYLENGVERVKSIDVVDGEIEISLEGESALEEIPSLEFNLPEVENYEPGILKQSIQVEGSYTEFCMYSYTKRKKYQHCGKQCGVFGKYGGGKLVNRIDGCCAIHDDCYKNKRRTKVCCDKALIKCAKNSMWDDYDAYLAIKAYFNVSAQLCRDFSI